MMEKRLRRTEIMLCIIICVFGLTALMGAYSTSDEIILRDSANGNIRISLKVAPNGPAAIQIYSSNGVRRMYIGETETGLPVVSWFDATGKLTKEISP